MTPPVDPLRNSYRVAAANITGGIGRTGMVIGCRLVRHGTAPEYALDQVNNGFRPMNLEKLVRNAGKTAPATSEQKRVLREWLPTASSRIDRGRLRHPLQPLRQPRLPPRSRRALSFEHVRPQSQRNQYSRMRRNRPTTFAESATRKHLVSQLRQLLVPLGLNDMRIDLRHVRTRSTLRIALFRGHWPSSCGRRGALLLEACLRPAILYIQ